MCRSSAVELYTRDSSYMTNFAYTGSAGSQSITCTTACPPAIGSLALIVADDEDTRFLLRYLSEQRGCAVVEAVDGEETVQQAVTTHLT